jgi:hypothetical protein
MYLPLTYTLLEVDAAIAPDREAMTTTVAIASLLNMGISVCWRAAMALTHTPMISPSRREKLQRKAVGTMSALREEAASLVQ